MAKNLNRTENAGISVPVAVPDGTDPGDVIVLGGAVLAHVITERVTQAKLDNYNLNTPQGLKDGQASVELIGCHLSVNLPLEAAVAALALVYQNPNTLTYTGAASSTVGTVTTQHIRIGIALEASAGAGNNTKVGLLPL